MLKQRSRTCLHAVPESNTSSMCRKRTSSSCVLKITGILGLDDS